jgi:NAD(P)H-dependent flavin oxidoreductase YrpB (nitropropane dioxygenase family)
MPGVSTVALVRAVCAAGGLGMLPATLLRPETLAGELAALGESVFGVNFLMPFLDPQCLDIASQHARVVEFFYGDPDAALVQRARRHGALVSWQVGSVREAQAAVAAGADIVVAQGTEAGGHVRGQSSVLPLLSQVLDAVSVPVLAAGGLATRRDVAAVTAAGAAGVRVGTRFVASRESGAHAEHIARILAAGPGDTTLTLAFSDGWPDAPHRVLRSSIVAAEQITQEVVGTLVIGDAEVPVPRFSVMCPNRDTHGHIEAMALYAGESVANIDSIRTVAEIVAELFPE